MKQKIHEKLKLFVLSFSLILFFSCSDDSFNYAQGEFLPAIDASNLPSSYSPITMFEDDEDPSLMYNKEDRWFRMNELVQVVVKSKNEIQVSLYSPVGLSDVKVYAKIPNYDKKFVVFHFSYIPAFHRSIHNIPLTEGTFDYELENGNAVTIDQIDGIPDGAIEFSVESTDPLFQKFKKIKSKHLVQFHDGYHLNELGKYLPMNPALAKEAVTLMINFSYALSHPLYYDTFMNFDRYKREQAERAGTKVNGALDWHGNKDDINGKYDYYSKEDIEEIYWNWLDSRTIYTAMVGGAAALGGGPLVSSWESTYVSSHWVGGVAVWTHEYAHHINHGHSSNLANDGEGGGHQEMMARFMEYLIHINDLPFTDPEILQTWTKTQYISKQYSKPVLKINPNNPFLLKYKGEGAWK